MGSRADTGREQKLRRVEGAAADDHFAARAQHLCDAGACDADADRAATLEHDALHLRVRPDRQVAAAAAEGAIVGIAMVQVGARAVPALAVALCYLVIAGAVLFGAVEVAVERDAGLHRGLDEARGKRVGRAQLVDVQRAVLAVVPVIERMVGFAATEVGEHIFIAPALAAQLRPGVVVLAVATDIDHAIDRRATAQAAPARLIGASAVEPRLRHGAIGVVARTGFRDDRRNGHRGPDAEVMIARASFKQGHGHAGILCQPRRDGAPG